MEQKKIVLDKSALDKVREKHSQFSEEIEWLKCILPCLYDKDACSNIRKATNFFKDNIVSHFDDETPLFKVALVVGDTKIKEIVRDLQHEHISMLSIWDKINDIILKHGFSFSDEKIKEEFASLTNRMLELFIPHARKEDEELFPYLEDKGMNIDLKCKKPEGQNK